MASDASFVEHICEQASAHRRLSFKKMFGEYALYLDGKLIALVCDNQLFVKPTPEGRGILDTVSEYPPYPGAKPHFRIEDIDDRELLQRLFETTAAALPLPKPKAAKGRKRAAPR